MRPIVPAVPRRVIPSALSKLKRRLDSLHAMQGGPEIPTTPRKETRVYSHNLRRAPCFPPLLEMRAHSRLQLKRNPNFPLHHQGMPVSPTESRLETPGSCCKEKGHQIPPQLGISPDSPAPAPRRHRGSPHNMMGGLTPLRILLK